MEAIFPEDALPGQVGAVRQDQLRVRRGADVVNKLTDEYATEHDVQNPPWNRSVRLSGTSPFASRNEGLSMPQQAWTNSTRTVSTSSHHIERTKESASSLDQARQGDRHENRHTGAREIRRGEQRSLSSTHVTCRRAAVAGFASRSGRTGGHQRRRRSSSTTQAKRLETLAGRSEDEQAAAPSCSQSEEINQVWASIRGRYEDRDESQDSRPHRALGHGPRPDRGLPDRARGDARHRAHGQVHAHRNGRATREADALRRGRAARARGAQARGTCVSESSSGGARPAGRRRRRAWRTAARTSTSRGFALSGSSRARRRRVRPRPCGALLGRPEGDSAGSTSGFGSAARGDPRVEVGGRVRRLPRGRAPAIPSSRSSTTSPCSSTRRTDVEEAIRPGWTSPTSSTRERGAVFVWGPEHVKIEYVEQETDVRPQIADLVVPPGLAGLAASARARELGAEPLLLEKGDPRAGRCLSRAASSGASTRSGVPGGAGRRSGAAR